VLLLCEELSLRAVNVGILLWYAGTLIEEKEASSYLDMEIALQCKQDVWYGISFAFSFMPDTIPCCR